MSLLENTFLQIKVQKELHQLNNYCFGTFVLKEGYFEGYGFPRDDEKVVVYIKKKILRPAEYYSARNEKCH